MDRTSLEKQVSDKIAETRDMIRRLYKAERRGLLTDDTLRDEVISDALYTMNLLFSKNGLRRRIDHGNWLSFLNDHALWQAGRPAGSFSDNGWFLYSAYEDRQRGDGEENAPCAWVSAPGWAKEQFFRVIDEYRVPPEYLAPLPEDIPDPNDTLTHRYHDSSDHLIRFECADDGGLLSDPAPTGKHFSLTGNNGTRADITVRHVYGEGEQREFRNHYLPERAGTMDADGWLEGYMTERTHSFIILRPVGRTLMISVRMDREDENAFYAFPLWEKYFAWLERKDRLLYDCLCAHYREVIKEEKPT